MLSRADQALGRLDGSIRTLPHADLFVRMFARQEAVRSSQIEGTQSSLQDLLEAEAEIPDPSRPRDVSEVLNYVRAMNRGLELLTSLPVSVRLIREIHAELMRGVRGSHATPGELRTSQNWIGSSGASVADAVFVPPPAHEVPGALSDLERFLHEDRSLPLLIKIGLAHAQFETIHPFLDGNGRAGRLLITFLLCEQKMLSKPVLYLSNYLNQHRQAYYDELQSVRRGEWERWLTFFLRGVAEVSDQAARTAGRILEQREEFRRQITEGFGRTAANAHRVLEHLYEHPIVSVSEVCKVLGVSYPSASSLVERLVAAGLLRAQWKHRRRHRLFVFSKYIQLFHDQPA